MDIWGEGGWGVKRQVREGTREEVASPIVPSLVRIELMLSLSFHGYNVPDDGISVKGSWLTDFFDLSTTFL